MKERTLGAMVAVLLILLAITGFLTERYNSIIEKDELVKKSWADVEALYQERMNIISTLMNVMKLFMQQEQAIFLGVTEARSKASGVKIDPTDLSPKSLEQFAQAQSGVNNALSKLLVTVEAYPEIKSNQNFLDLQKQLQAIESKLADGRQMFNLAVKEYNTGIRKFPNSMIAQAAGFETKISFSTNGEAEH